MWSRHQALSLLAAAWPELVSGEPPSCDRLDALLGRVSSTWRVVRATQARSSYEQAVMAGVIPTREGSWHDVFNVLAFARFPVSKQALHRRVGELQMARRAKARTGDAASVGPSRPQEARTGDAARGSRANDRSREEDALALIDECSLVLAGAPEAIAAYEQIQAGPLEVIDRTIREHGIRVRVLGHALHEHLVLARPPISTTLVTVALAGPIEWPRVDAALAERIAAGGFPAPQREARLPWPDPVVDSWLE